MLYFHGFEAFPLQPPAPATGNNAAVHLETVDLWYSIESVELIAGRESRGYPLRAFIAIELPETIQSVLSDMQGEFRKGDTDIRWVRPHGIHLTLKFLGSIKESMVRDITDILQKAAGSSSAFTLTLSGTGVFPNMRSPRVLWVGIEESSVLNTLQRDIESGLESLGFGREKRNFTAHLTLGRFKSARGKAAVMEALESYAKRTIGSFDVESVSLIKSDLGPAGAKYTRLAEIRLGKGEINTN